MLQTSEIRLSTFSSLIKEISLKSAEFLLVIKEQGLFEDTFALFSAANSIVNQKGAKSWNTVNTMNFVTLEMIG